MGLRIQTNTSAAGVQRNLRVNTQSHDASLEKLSSGSRINKAADDAAGLSVSEGIRADIRSSRQGIRNGQDGISMVQTAEGALSEISSNLIRLRELSIQSASDTIGNPERGMLDMEAQQIITEIERIAHATEHNGTKMLDVHSQVLQVQMGIHNNPDADRIYMDNQVGNSTISRLGVDSVHMRTKAAAHENLSKVDRAIDQVSKNRASLGAMSNRLQSGINDLMSFTENLSAGHSRIKDVDLAHESSEMMRTKLLTESGTSLLTQANHSGNLVLKLLG